MFLIGLIKYIVKVRWNILLMSTTDMDEKVNERRGERENKVNDKRDEGL